MAQVVGLLKHGLRGILGFKRRRTDLGDALRNFMRSRSRLLCVPGDFPGCALLLLDGMRHTG